MPITHQRKNRFQEAFSLLELLLVIFIISLVYFLGFSGVEKPKKQQTLITPLTLKSTLMHDPLFQGERTFLCINACKSCYIRKNISEPFEEYKGKLQLHKATSYIVNRNNMLQELEPGRYQDQKVCLLFHIFPNGSSTPLIIQTTEGIYFLPSYFGKPQKVDSLEEGRDLWLQYDDALSGQGDFY
jgi:hypothetical protein